MSNNHQTTEYVRAFAELERIAIRMKSGSVTIDDLEALLTRADQASAIVHARIQAVSRLVRRSSERRSSTRP